ncbi:hypothetical protein E2C01_083196 [Portunus trituberculatus]|uniref:Uncharacterized protein n=1 Tax=Portunus trituberculatus TaxID=210409 RepID=A0A5B7J0I8_PORTR|nr:hypothetical protein [Portunus trituberculatus]
MWAFHRNFWAKGDTFLWYFLSQSPPARKPFPRVRKPNLHSYRGQDSNSCAWRPSDPKACMVPLYHGHDTVLLQATVDYVNITIMMETVKALAASRCWRKARWPRRIWSWPYLQRRVELGYYGNLMGELAIKYPPLHKNFRIDKDLFSEVLERVKPHIQMQENLLNQAQASRSVYIPSALRCHIGARTFLAVQCHLPDAPLR